jgi:uncharacterized protein (TIGR02246 family)
MQMKQLLFVALFVLSTPFLTLGQTANANGDGTARDDAAIRKVMKDVAEVWNKHDVVAFSMLFAEDADFTNWRGDVRVHGREEIEKEHTDSFAGMFRQSKLTVVDTQIRFFAPDVAAVQCEWRLVGTIDYDGKGIIPPRKYTSLYPDKEEWKLVNRSNAQLIVPTVASWSYNGTSKVRAVSAKLLD